MIIVKNK